MTGRSRNPLAVWVHGCSGRMGHELQTLMADETLKSFRLVGGSDRLIVLAPRLQGELCSAKNLALAARDAELLLDFSSPPGTELLLKAVNQGIWKHKFIIIGTTGLTDAVKAEWKAASEAHDMAILMAPNTSLGIMLMLQTGLRIAGALMGNNFDIELVESHHRSKADAPSGTAKLIAEEIAKAHDLKVVYGRDKVRQADELGVASLRGGNVFGEHSLKFLGDLEEIEISHRALSRQVFAKGALILGTWLSQQTPGFYSLRDVSLDPAQTI